MNRKLVAALAAVLLVTAYLQSQGDDELLAKPERGVATGAPGSSGREGRPASRPDVRRTSGAQGAGSEAAGSDAALAPWVADALVRGVHAWQGRTRAASAEPMVGRSGPTASAWAAAPPPAPPVIRSPVSAEGGFVAPTAPVAPRFPHQWVGRFNQGAVLSGADATWVVQAGDVIEGQWRVDRVDERRMSLTYLPLNLPQQVVMR